jgi:hypothetical protein
MAAPHAFRRQVEKRAEKSPPITFVLETTDENDEVVRSDVMEAKRPSEERIFLFVASIGGEDTNFADEAAAILSLFRDILRPADYSVLRERLADDDDEVDLQMLREIIEWLVSQWADFPTKPSSVSSESPTPIGQSSTGRSPGKGSTRSRTASTAS